MIQSVILSLKFLFSNECLFQGQKIILSGAEICGGDWWKSKNS